MQYRVNINTTVNWIKVNTVTDDIDRTVTSNNFGGEKNKLILIGQMCTLSSLSRLMNTSSWWKAVKLSSSLAFIISIVGTQTSIILSIFFCTEKMGASISIDSLVGEA